MEYIEYGDSNVNGNVNTYEANTVDDIVKDIKDKIFNCQDCQWQNSCKNYLSQILSDPDYDIDDIKNEVNDFNNCKEFYNAELDENRDTEVVYNRDEYEINYNTYIYEFNNG